MKLHALSDLHVGSSLNLEAVAALAPKSEDWLILAGDVGETVEHLRTALTVLTPKFAKVIWVPGNHDLWSIDPSDRPLRGEYKYRRLVEICREFGVLTPEDPYPVWPGSGEGGHPPVVIAPLFLLYDYSFRPDDVADTDAVSWAGAAGVRCGDEDLLDSVTHKSRKDWCALRVQLTEQRLKAATANGERVILINHWPLREDLLTARGIESFSLWCGTRSTEDWHLRFNAEAVIYGHLHLPGTQFRDGVRFEEVSLGYPTEWDGALGIEARMRQILPVPVEQTRFAAHLAGADTAFDDEQAEDAAERHDDRRQVEKVADYETAE
jgi:hypothetical protein